MLYSFIFFHTTIQVNDPEASLSNTINKQPCKNTTQAGINHKILLNPFFNTKILILLLFFFIKNTFSLSFYFPTNAMLKYDKNTLHEEYSYTSIVQYSYILLYEYCGQLWTILVYEYCCRQV